MALARGLRDICMEIRRALPSDIQQVVGFTRNTFPWGDYVPQVVEEWVHEGTAYVAVDGDLVLGIVNVVPLPTGVLWLEGIRVKAEFRRRGVGRALTRYALDQGVRMGMEYAMLMIAEWNEPSHSLARSLGFRPVLKLWTGVSASTNPRKADRHERMRLIEEALERSNGYFCWDWRCTRASPSFVDNMVEEIYVGPGIALGNFSVGPPTTPREQEVLATEPGEFVRSYGIFIVYELKLE